MRSLMLSLRRLVLGETWTIPLGVGAALGLAIVLRASMSAAAWQAAGGFCLAILVVATLAYSLRRPRGGRP